MVFSPDVGWISGRVENADNRFVLGTGIFNAEIEPTGQNT